MEAGENTVKNLAITKNKEFCKLKILSNMIQVHTNTVRIKVLLTNF